MGLKLWFFKGLFLSAIFALGANSYISDWAKIGQSASVSKFEQKPATSSVEVPDVAPPSNDEQPFDPHPAALLPTEDDYHPDEFSSASDRNEHNPVQDLIEPGSPNASQPISTPQNTASSRAFNGCEAVKSAVVTVRADREIGSGSIVSANGIVITNHHVVKRLGDRPLSVQTQDGSQYAGQVVASDRRNDLALIQLETQSPLPTVRIAASTTPTVGEMVCAIGSPFGRAGTVTQGNLVRILPNGDLQSNVELQPGNSGGPLINARGEMIGVNKGVARDRRGRDRKTYAERGLPQRISFSTNSIVANSFLQRNQTSAAFPKQNPY